MPQEDGIKKAASAIKDSKKVLASAEKKFPSAMAKGIVDTKKPATPAVPAAKKSDSPAFDGGSDTAEGIKARQEMGKGLNVDDAGIPKMHTGGEVKEDGLKDLQKGEVVIPKEKSDEGKKIMGLKEKAKGAMGAAIDEEKEPASEEKGETKKEEKAEGKHKTSDKHNPAHETKKEKKTHMTVIHHHKAGHTMHHMKEDGSNEMHQFALGDHSGMGKNIGDMLAASGQGAPEPEGGAPEGGAPQGGAPQGGM